MLLGAVVGLCCGLCHPSVRTSRNARLAPPAPSSPQGHQLGPPASREAGREGPQPSCWWPLSSRKMGQRGGSWGPLGSAVCLVGGPSLKGTSVPCHIPLYPVPPHSCQNTLVGGQPPPTFLTHRDVWGLGALGAG